MGGAPELLFRSRERGSAVAPRLGKMVYLLACKKQKGGSKHETKREELPLHKLPYTRWPWGRFPNLIQCVLKRADEPGRRED